MTVPAPAPDPDPKIGDPAPAPAPPPPAPTQQPPSPDDFRLKAIEAQLADTGKERDGYKTILEKLSSVLNPGESLKPEELSAQLKERNDQLAEHQREIAVLRIAGGDLGSSLLDSRKFLKSVQSLAPGSDAFAAKVKEAVEAAKPSPTPTDEDKGKTDKAGSGKSGGVDMNGGRSGGQKQLTRADLANMSSEEIMKAQEDGLLDNLMTGKA